MKKKHEKLYPSGKTRVQVKVGSAEDEWKATQNNTPNIQNKLVPDIVRCTNFYTNY